MKRRTFIGAASLLAASTSALANPVVQQKKLAHQVYFWLKNAGSAEDRAKLIEGIKTLKKIKSVEELYIGTDAATQKRAGVDHSWDVSLLVFMKDVAGEAAYQIDPIHLDFVKNYSGLWAKAAIYDSQVI